MRAMKLAMMAAAAMAGCGESSTKCPSGTSACGDDCVD
jgi:hypothetical protein